MKINHQVLNARFHEKEANIIAQAGKPYAVTIATNMAGRRFPHGVSAAMGSDGAVLVGSNSVGPTNRAGRRLQQGV